MRHKETFETSEKSKCPLSSTDATRRDAHSSSRSYGRGSEVWSGCSISAATSGESGAAFEEEGMGKMVNMVSEDEADMEENQPLVSLLELLDQASLP